MKQHLEQCCQQHSYSAFRKQMNTWLFDLNSPVGKRLNLIIMVIIVCGAFVSMLETLQHVTDRWESLIQTLSIIVTIIFSIEYLLRIYTAKSPLQYVFSFYGLIDLLAVLPAIIMGDFNTAIRLLRVLRLLKLIRYLKALELFVASLQDVFEIILVSIIAISLIVLLGGKLIFYLEPSSVSNAFEGTWWALVTITTVGYGDIVPHTPAGQIVASFLMLLGFGMFAMLTGIISIKVAHILTHKTQCPNCERPLDEKSIYCNFCGIKVDQYKLKRREYI